ncbi:hypothetical protein I4F81_011211 [Pyropia yezoensis]|uniref:Uncharacterized protein n=1 Tax=Pyropia yezoensis TaxID=2788 RepID=A0ACC3CFY2_PYRYE|nr:hypothetical protein I4F81_011211 [Neopyropia yezoensis]
MRWTLPLPCATAAIAVHAAAGLCCRGGHPTLRSHPVRSRPLPALLLSAARPTTTAATGATTAAATAAPAATARHAWVACGRDAHGQRAASWSARWALPTAMAAGPPSRPPSPPPSPPAGSSLVASAAATSDAASAAATAVPATPPAVAASDASTVPPSSPPPPVVATSGASAMPPTSPPPQVAASDASTVPPTSSPPQVAASDASTVPPTSPPPQVAASDASTVPPSTPPPPPPPPPAAFDAAIAEGSAAAKTAAAALATADAPPPAPATGATPAATSPQRLPSAPPVPAPRGAKRGRSPPIVISDGSPSPRPSRPRRQAPPPLSRAGAAAAARAAAATDGAAVAGGQAAAAAAAAEAAAAPPPLARGCPLVRASGTTPDAVRLRFLTWNVDMDTRSVRARTAAVVRALRALTPPPDVVALQEVSTADVYEEGVSSFEVLRSGLCGEKAGGGRSTGVAPPPGDAASAAAAAPPLRYQLAEDVWPPPAEAPPPPYAAARPPPYFTLLLVREGAFARAPSSGAVTRTPFPASRMGRDLLTLTATVRVVGADGDANAGTDGDAPANSGDGNVGGPVRRPPLRVAVSTGHLESTTDPTATAERRSQLRTLAASLNAAATGGAAAVWGGDGNLRAADVPATLVRKALCEEETPPPKRYTSPDGGDVRLSDAFVQAGSPAAAAYTWDTSVNDNKSFPGAAYAPRARFDRVLTSGPPGLRPVTEHLSLVGTTRVRGGVFPSDHWGVCVDLLLPLPPLSPGGGGR